MQFDKGYISPVLRDRPRGRRGRPRGPVHPDHHPEDLGRSPTCCRCWRRSSRPASRWSSSPRTSTARRCRRWSSTRSARRSPRSRSRRRSSATAARRSCRTSRSSPAPRSSRPRSASSSTRSGSTSSARPAGSSSPRTRPRSRTARGAVGEIDDADRADPPRDRRHRLRLGPREAAGAAGQARRRRRRHQGRRGHRGRAQGAQAPHRGRHLGDPRSDRGGHHRRRRGGARARRRAALDGDLGLAGDEATGVDDRAQRARRAAALDRRPTPASRATSSSPKVRELPDRTTASTPRPASTWTCCAAGVVDPVKVTKAALANAASRSPR